MRHRENGAGFVAMLALAVVLTGRAAHAQPVEPPSPSPSAVPAPSPSLPPAGTIPASISLDVTGLPAADPAFLEQQIREALNRAIRPTLRPGASASYGPIVPWPLSPLVAGTRAAVNVTVAIAGDDASAAATGVTTVTLNSIVMTPPAPPVLFLSDDPEYIETEGLIFRGTIPADSAARLYYYHSDIGVPRDLDIVLTATVPSRVQIIASKAGPDPDVLSVGHAVSRDFLQFVHDDEGIVVDVLPGKPFIVRHALIIQSEVAAGIIDAHVLSGGAVTVSVVGSPAGGHPEAYLNGPRVPFDGHRRHGTFDLLGFGNIAASYSVGGPDTAVQYGGRSPTLRNVDPNDGGFDYGDYGVIHRLTFTLVNPTDAPHIVYFYEKPLAGPVRSSFVVDGQIKELGCVRMPQQYWLTTYQLPPHSKSASTSVTMTDGGSFYPLEFGVTDTQPLSYTPPVGTPDGCSPRPSPFGEPTAATNSKATAKIITSRSAP